MLKLILGALLVAAGIVVYKRWKAGQTITTATVVADVKTEVSDAAAAAKPGVMALLKTWLAKLFFKA